MRIGFIGLGNVGAKLAGSLLRHGISLTVRDLNPDLGRQQGRIPLSNPARQKVTPPAGGGVPFPDATPEFFATFQEAVNKAIDGEVEVIRPFAGLSCKDGSTHRHFQTRRRPASQIQCVRDLEAQ